MTSIIDGLVPLTDVAEDLRVSPARIYGACVKLGVPVPKLGEGRVLQKDHVKLIRDEIARRAVTHTS